MKTLNISERTKQEIAKFFLATSVPRILERQRKEKEQKEESSE